MITNQSTMVFDGVTANFHSMIVASGEQWLVFKGWVQETAHKKAPQFYAFRKGSPDDFTTRESLKGINKFLGI